MTKHNFYIITGGPGGGKTTLLNVLALKGYRYIGDTARDLIRQRLAKDLPPRPDPASFARQIFFQDFENYLSNANTTSLLFFDRSFMDSANLLYNADFSTYRKIKNTHLINRYNQKVFITPPWKEIYCNDSERDQTFEQAIEVHARVCSWYTQHDYEIITIPNDTIENRANFVLDCVSL